MYKVKKKPLTPNMIWDAENNQPLCKFDRKGIIETNDDTLAVKLKALGHEVSGEADVDGDKLELDGEAQQVESADDPDDQNEVVTGTSKRRNRK